MKIPIRYLPKHLTTKNRQNYTRQLLASRKLYKKGKYLIRDKVNSFTHKESQHIKNARKIYNLEHIVPSRELATKTGCSIHGLRQIVRKGEGAYYSSGSRPNQTARSWGLARLASSITGGKSSSVDLHILKKECNPTKKAFQLAIKTPGYGRRTTKHVFVR